MNTLDNQRDFGTLTNGLTENKVDCVECGSNLDGDIWEWRKIYSPVCGVCAESLLRAEVTSS